MQTKTLYFGEVVIDEDKIYSFSEGLPGFPEETSFCLLQAEDMPFLFLQSLNNEQLCFVVIRIFDFFPDYERELPEHIIETLKIKNRADVELMGIVRLRDQPEQYTVNLLAPIVLNRQNRNAQQIILQDNKYSLQTLLRKVREG